MKLIHIVVLLQTAPNDDVHGTFKMFSVTPQWTECSYIHIGQVFLSSENSFSI